MGTIAVVVCKVMVSWLQGSQVEQTPPSDICTGQHDEHVVDVETRVSVEERQEAIQTEVECRGSSTRERAFAHPYQFQSWW